MPRMLNSIFPSIERAFPVSPLALLQTCSLFPGLRRRVQLCLSVMLNLSWTKLVELCKGLLTVLQTKREKTGLGSYVFGKIACIGTKED